MEMGLSDYLKLMFLYIFVQNFVLAQFLGLCPFIGVSKKRDDAIGMGMAIIFVMTIAAIITLLLYRGLFNGELFEAIGLQNLAETTKSLKMGAYLDIVAFVLLIAALVQFIETIMKKTMPTLYKSLGIYLPLMSTNCAILGAAQLKINEFVNLPLGEALIRNMILGFAGGIGVLLALYLMSGIRERLELAPIPECMKGVPIAFLSTFGIALSFLGLSGLVDVK